MPTATARKQKLQPVIPGTLYPLPTFQEFTGFGRHAMRTARRQGLRVRYLGGRAFVHADDFFDYLSKLDCESGASQ